MREETPREALSQGRKIFRGQTGNRRTSKEAQSSREDEALASKLGWTVDEKTAKARSKYRGDGGNGQTNGPEARLLTTLRGAANFKEGTASQGAAVASSLDPSQEKTRRRTFGSAGIFFAAEASALIAL
jgi:hypothetical protein